MPMRNWMRCFAAAVWFAASSGVALHAESDVALSIYGAFNGATSGNGVQESPSNAAGGIFELRHISNPLMGWKRPTPSTRPIRCTPRLAART